MFKHIKGVFTPNPDRLAVEYLVEARIQLLSAEAAKEHFIANVDMLKKRIERLTKEIQLGNPLDVKADKLS